MPIRSVSRAALFALAGAVAIVACSSSSTTNAGGPAKTGDAASIETGAPAAEAGSDAAPEAAKDSASAADGGTCTLVPAVTLGNGPACDACIASECCEPLNACFTDAECTAYDQCTGVCVGDGGTGNAGPDGGTNACLNACALAHPTALALERPWQECIALSCAGDCQ